MSKPPITVPRLARGALRLLFLAAASCLALLSSARAQAPASLTWDSNGFSTSPNPSDGGGTWDTTSQLWWNGSSDVAWDNSANATTIATFGAAGAAGIVNVSGAINAGGLAFNATNTTSAYTLQGGTVALASGSLIDIMDGASGVGPRITLNSALTGNNILLRNNSGTNVGFALINLGGNNNFTGTLTLTGNATGGLFVSATSATALNGGASISVSSNTTLSLAAAAGTNWAQAITITGTGSANRGAIRIDSGSTATPTVLSGPITLGASGSALYLNTGITANITGNIGDGGNNYALNVGYATSTFTGGVMTLSGNNTFTGGLNIDGGSIIINNAGALNSTAPNAVSFTSNSLAKGLSLNGNSITIAGLTSAGAGAVTLQNANATAAALTVNMASGTTSFNGTITNGAGGGAFSLVKNGAGTLTLAGSTTSDFTGGVILNAGTLNLNKASAVGTGTFTINGGTINNNSGAAVTLTNAADVWNSDFTYTGSNSLNFGTAAVSLGAAAGTTRTITTSGTTTVLLTVGGVISDGTTATGLIKAGTGVLVLSGANTFSGGLTLNAGILDINSATAPGTGLFTIAGGTIDNTTAAAIALTNNNLQSWTGDFTFTGTQALDLGTGAVTLGGTGTTRTVTVTANTLTVGGSISPGATAVGITKAGNGVLILNGSNLFTGPLAISAGEVRLGNAGALNASTPVSVSFSNNANNKTLTLNGNSVTVAGLASSGGAGTITVQNANATASTLTIGNSAASSYGGTLTDGTGGGALSLVEAGSAAQTLSGAVSLSGSITVNSGTLTASGVISATSGVTVNAGVLTLSGANTYATSTVLNAGTLNINNATALGSSSLTINGGIIDNNTAAAISLTTTNAQTWNSDFAFTGTHSLNMGTGAVSLGTGAGTTRTITTNGSSTLTIGGVISDGTTAKGLIKAGAGTLVLSGANTFSGPVTVNTGILNLQNNFALGAAGGGLTVADNARVQLQGGITISGESLTTGILESVSGVNKWIGDMVGPATTQLTLQADTGATAADFTFAGNINANAHTTNLTGAGTGEITGVISNVFATGGVNMNGTGTWILSGANTYAATTNVNSGNLQVGKGGVGKTGTLATTVAAAGTLSGTGTIVGAATVTGTISPGDSAGLAMGKLNFSAGLTTNPTVATNSALLTISNNAAGDNIHVTGALTLNANSNLVVTFASGYQLLSGESWDLLDWSGLLTLNGFNTGTNFRTGPSGAQGNLILPDLTLLPGYTNQTWQISTLTDGSTGGGALIITVTPEPSRNLLCLAGLLSLALRRSRGTRRA